MQVSATVRVTSDQTSEQKPNAGRLKRAAELLKKAGFDILRIGRFGVSVRGEEAAFRDVLGVIPKANKALIAPSARRVSELRELVDLVEVAPPAQLY
jgi:hypothetical protein